MTNTTSAFSVDEVLKKSWASVKKDWTKYLTLFLSILLMYVVFGVVVGVFSRLLNLPQIIYSILSMLLGVYVVIVTSRGSLMIIRGKKLDMGEVTQFDSKTYLSTFGAMILYYIACLIGFILFIIPGIIASIMFSATFFSIVDKGTEAVQALEDSARMTKGNRWNIFFFQILLFLLTTAAIVLPSAVLFIGTWTVTNALDKQMGLGVGVGMAIIGCLIFLSVGVVSGMVSTAARAYMYTKMRAKTPLSITK